MCKNTFYLVCDESGAKAQSDKQAKDTGIQLGVFAGILFRSKNKYEEFCNKICALAEKCQLNDSSKIHITDIDNAKKEPLREQIFELIKTSDAYCVYEALPQDGLFNFIANQNQLNTQIMQDNLDKGYKINPTRSKESLHAELFIGMFMRAFSTCATYADGFDFTLHIITDKISGMKKSFEEKINEILNFSEQSEQDITSTRYNISTGEVEINKGKIKFDITMPAELRMPGIGKFQYTLEESTDDRTLAADILANSLLYSLNKVFSENPSIRLTSTAAIALHPLKNIFTCLTNENDYDFMQSIYSYK